jgi:DNA replication protein DnaD
MSEKKLDYIQSKVDSVADTVANIDKDMALQKAALEAHTKQDEKMYEEFTRMNDILQVNTASLKEHMQQTMLLKELVIKMDKRLSPMEVEYIQKTAVKDWVLTRVKFLGKLGFALAAVEMLWLYAHPLLTHLFK